MGQHLVWWSSSNGTDFFLLCARKKKGQMIRFVDWEKDSLIGGTKGTCERREKRELFPSHEQTEV